MILPDRKRREQENQRLRGRCGMENGRYADYAYYIKNYLGTGLLLRNLARICWLHLRSLTSLPSVGSTGAGYSSGICKRAACAAAECLYQNEVRAEREITSESNDGLFHDLFHRGEHRRMRLQMLWQRYGLSWLRQVCCIEDFPDSTILRTVMDHDKRHMKK